VDYLHREIRLNRARLTDYLVAIRCSGLSILHLSVLPDRCLSQLPFYLEAIRSKSWLEVADLAVEGFAVELVRLPERAASIAADYRPVAQARLDAERRQLGEEVATARAEAAAAREALEVERAEAAALRQQVSDLGQDVAQLRGLLAMVEESWSFRIGRAVTAPGRWLRLLWWANR
jgi:hypothetical protein